MIALNMNIYLEEIADEYLAPHRSANSHHRQRARHHSVLRRGRGGIRPSQQQSTVGGRGGGEAAAVKAVAGQQKDGDQTVGSKEVLATGPSSSWVSDPEDQWAWLYKVMEESRRKRQNVSLATLSCSLLSATAILHTVYTDLLPRRTA